MGPWLVYSSLLNGAAMALFQGSPMGRGFGEFVAAAKVTMLGLVPSLARAWQASRCMEGLRWKDTGLRCFSSTGEASAPAQYLWLSWLGGGAPVVEYCGGTEIGGGFLAGGPLQPQAPSTFSTPTVGAAPVLLVQRGSGRGDSCIDDGVGPATGELALRVPMLGCSQRLLNRDHRKEYYAGMPSLFLRRHGDEFERLPGGRWRALGRVDDTMNLGGIKVASVELERACLEGTAGLVSEAAAVAVPPPGGGPDRLVLFVVPKAAVAEVETLRRVCQEAVSLRLNPLFRVDRVVLVRELPRTSTGKVLRRALRCSRARL
jgi:acyl-coenzyme A synthetase/AMP-(fatty) acid ligase